MLSLQTETKHHKGTTPSKPQTQTCLITFARQIILPNQPYAFTWIQSYHYFINSLTIPFHSLFLSLPLPFLLYLPFPLDVIIQTNTLQVLAFSDTGREFWLLLLGT